MEDSCCPLDIYTFVLLTTFAVAQISLSISYIYSRYDLPSYTSSLASFIEPTPSLIICWFLMLSINNQRRCREGREYFTKYTNLYVFFFFFGK